MPPTKRKSVSDADLEKSSKKPRNSSSKAQSVSLLRTEEPAFPRGGASVLTPLEHKQIQIQATRDVLFEQKTGRRHSGIESGDEENDGDEGGGEPSAAISNVPRKSRSKAKDKKSSITVEEHGMRIESLSYKVSLDSGSRSFTKSYIASCARLYGPGADIPNQQIRHCLDIAQ